MKIIYGTGNQAKIASMKRALVDLEIEIIGLNDMNIEIPDIIESGNTPIENARIKATAYYKMFRKPVFSCDSGLYFDNLPEHLQPGVHVRNVNGKYLTDEEMIKYYGELAQKYGNLKARYRNAICFIYDENHIYESIDEELSGGYFFITARPHEKRIKGFPLDSLSLEIISGKYYFDLGAYQADDIALDNGFCKFFKDAFGKINMALYNKERLEALGKCKQK